MIKFVTPPSREDSSKMDGWMETPSKESEESRRTRDSPGFVASTSCIFTSCCTLHVVPCGTEDDISRVHPHVISHLSMCLSSCPSCPSDYPLLSSYSPSLPLSTSAKAYHASSTHVCVCVGQGLASQNCCILFIQSKQCPVAKITLQLYTYARLNHTSSLAILFCREANGSWMPP